MFSISGCLIFPLLFCCRQIPPRGFSRASSSITLLSRRSQLSAGRACSCSAARCFTFLRCFYRLLFPFPWWPYVALAPRHMYADSAAFGVASIRITVGLLSDTCFRRPPPRPAAVSDAYTTRSLDRGGYTAVVLPPFWLAPEFPSARSQSLPVPHTVNVFFHLSRDCGLRLSVSDRAFIALC